jgi:hypothetical protein
MAKLYGSSYDLPFRGLPRELRDHIYRYGFRVPQSIDMLAELTCPHDYWARGDTSNLCPQIWWISTSIPLLFANRQMSSEALFILYGENVFQFSSCSSNRVEDFANALRPASLAAIRHIEINIICAFEENMGPEADEASHFLTTLSNKFTLDTLTIAVIQYFRTPKAKPRKMVPYLGLRTWLIPDQQVFPLLCGYLHSGQVRALRWVWEKVGCANLVLETDGVQQTPTSLVHLLNERVSKYTSNKISGAHDLLNKFQAAVEERAGGGGGGGGAITDKDTASDHNDTENFDITIFARWENECVLRMQVKRLSDSDSDTIQALRKIEQMKVGNPPHHQEA